MTKSVLIKFSKLAAAVALTVATSTVSAQVLRNGDAVIACKPDDGVTMGVKNIAELGRIWSDPANRGDKEWSSETPTTWMWKPSDFGGAPVFASSIDFRDGAIYTVTTSLYNLRNPGVGTRVYRIDPVSGNPSLLATLPGTAGGSYLEVDEVNDQLFAVDMDRGQIVRIDLGTGSILSTFDPGSADSSPAGNYPDLGERILGVTYNPNDNRVYYSVWANDQINNGATNTVRSVGLTAGGDFDSGDDQLEISVPPETFDDGTYSMPVGDIEFNDDGTKVLLAETGYNSGTPIVRAHRARVLEYTGSTGSWAIDTGTDKYEAGVLYKGMNSRGGADWAYEGIVAPEGGVHNDEEFIIFTMDGYAIGDYVPPNDIYGFQFYPTTGGDSVVDSVVVDVDGNTTNQDKSIYGDFDVYHKPLPVLPYDLALRKRLYNTQASTEAGANAEFLIEVKNQSSVNSGAFTVSDAIPAGLGFVSATGTDFSCGASGQTVTCNFTGDLVPGEVAEFKLTVSVDDASMAPFRNWAEITADSGDDADSTTATNSASDNGPGTGPNGSDPVQNHNDLDHYAPNANPATDEDDSDYEDLVLGNYDLAITKERIWGTGNLAQWQSAFYIIKLFNQGTVASGEYTFREWIPAGMEFGDYQGKGFTCVDSSGNPLTPDVSLSIAGPDYVDCTAKQPIMPGEYDYEILRLKVVDESLAPFRNWVEIEADSGDDIDSVPGSNDALDSGAGTGGFGNDPVVNHNDIEHTGANGIASNDHDDSDYEDVTVDGVDISEPYDLALIKSVAGMTATPPVVGTDVTYTITVKNQSPTEASGTFTVTDTIPAGMTFVSASSTTAATSISNPGVGNTGAVTYTVPASSQLNAGSSVSFTLVLKIADASMSPMKNIAEITADSGDDKDSVPGDDSGATDTFDDENVNNDKDPDDQDDSDFAVVTVSAPLTYDLALIKEIATVTPSPAAVGSNVSYTITVRNQGTADSGTFTVTDLMPAGTTFVSASASATGTTVSGPSVGGNGTILFVVPSTSQLTPGQQTTFTVVLKIADATQSPFRNSAEITSDTGDDKDSFPGNGSGTSDTFDDHDVTNDQDTGDEDDSDFAVVTVDAPLTYDLALIKEIATVTPSPAAAGSNVSYTVTVRNQGTADSGTFTVTDSMPAGMTFVSASASIPTASVTAPAAGTTGPITFTVPTGAELSPAQQTTFNVVLKIADVTKSPFRNSAEITSDSGDDKDSTTGNGSGTSDTFDDHDVTNDQDPGDEDDSDFASVTVAAANYDLALVKTLAPGQLPRAAENDIVNYEVMIKNQGDVPSLGFTVTDAIPGGMQYVSANGNGFSCVHDGSATAGIATCSYTPPSASDLAPGATALIRLRLRMKDVTMTPFVNWAEIEDDSSANYGVTDADSTPGDHNAHDDSRGNGNTGFNPSIDHDNIDHDGSAHDERAEDEDDSDPAVIKGSATTPVTLSSFKANGNGDTAVVDFTTSTEEANLGFNIYGRISGNWKRLNAQMILAEDNGTNGGIYQAELRRRGATEFAIADVDIFGKETVHGPYDLDRQYGQPRNVAVGANDATDVNANPASADAVTIAVAENAANLVVRNRGIQRVTFEELRSAGISFTGVPVSALSLTFNDEPMAIFIGDSAGRPVTTGNFRPGQFIEFLAETASTMYRQHAVYALQYRAEDARRVTLASADTSSGFAAVTAATETWAPNNLYSRISPIEDAWFARRLTALQTPSSQRVTLAMPDYAARGNAVVNVQIWGASDNLTTQRDHRVVVSVNGTRVATRIFDGIAPRTISTDIPAGTLRVGNNIVEVTAHNPNTSGVSSVAIESVSIDYLARNVARQDRATLSGKKAGFVVRNLKARDVVVWRTNADGVSRMRARTTRQNSPGNVLFEARFAGSNLMSSYEVAAGDGFFKPVVRSAPQMDDLVSGPADYLIITHPTLNTSWLELLADARRADGYTVKVVNVSSIYQANASGNVDSGAIADYVAWAHQNLGTRMVLLVGGDTYDYHNKLKGKAKSLIPTLYAPSADLINHAPADPMYGDVDGDGVPEVAIGRFPVQTPAELKAVVEKTLQYATVDFSANAVFMTDTVDDATRRSFADDARELIAGLPSDWNATLASLDDLGTQRARNRVLSAVRNGVAVTGWIGHSDEAVWSFDSALSTSDLENLGNTGKPTVVTQFGCWNSYFVDPKRDTMAHAWLVNPDQGAAAVLGASTLTDATAEEMLAKALFEIITRDDVSIGEALVTAKRSLATEYSSAAVRDILSGYLLLGDPGLRIKR